MKIKTTEPQRKVLKGMQIIPITYVDMGRFSHAFWNTRSREQCTNIVKALHKKGLVEFIKREGSTIDCDVRITEAGKAAIQ